MPTLKNFVEEISEEIGNELQTVKDDIKGKIGLNSEDENGVFIPYIERRVSITRDNEYFDEEKPQNKNDAILLFSAATVKRDHYVEYKLDNNELKTWKGYLTFGLPFAFSMFF